ncbi:MAG: hypothetical protein AB1679_00840 [Actinomycetota bacterium]
MSLDRREARLVARTLRAGLVQAFGPEPELWSLLDPAGGDGLAGGTVFAEAPPHRLAPPAGARATTVYVVGENDTAAAMGHPDAAMAVVGSPRLGLWFELATSPLMPAPDSGARHVGVGLVVHHLGSAVVGEEVTVEARVQATTGRAVVFALTATVDGRLVASGVHHRRILDRHPAAG